MHALYMQHRQSPLVEALDFAQRGYISARDVGNHEWAGYSAYAFCANSFASGKKLAQLKVLMDDYYDRLVGIRQIAPSNWCQIYRQTVANLISSNPQEQNFFFGENTQEQNFLAELDSAKDLLGLYHYYLCKLIVAYLYEDTDRAYQNSFEAKSRIYVPKVLLDSLYFISMNL